MAFIAKSIDTLVKDIQDLFTNGHVFDEANLNEFGQSLARIIADRLAPYVEPTTPIAKLRMSSIGKPDRQLWYQTHMDTRGGENLPPSTQIKFLYGHILEALLLLLAKEAGHKVTDEQAEVEINGVKGHNDAIIDGVVVDVKSASSYSFQKFRDHTLQENDPFGYMEQIAGYSSGHGGLDAAFLAIDKTLGHICLDRYDAEELALLQIPERIEHLKKVVADPEMPPRCFNPEPEGKSGNLKLGVNCSYCPFKKDCWSDANGGIGLRTFIYAKGPLHLVHVEKEPLTKEVTF